MDDVQMVRDDSYVLHACTQGVHFPFREHGVGMGKEWCTLILILRAWFLSMYYGGSIPYLCPFEMSIGSLKLNISKDLKTTGAQVLTFLTSNTALV